MPTLAFLLAFLLVALTLFGVALYEHINSTSLSLPISPAVTIFTVLLPLAAAANALFYPRLARSHLRSNHALAWIFQGAQGIVTTVLATLLFSNLIPSAARDCLLSILWQRFFSSHDAESIRRIQDALNCCGFNTVRDRAWPFPNQQTSQQCAETYRRDTACIQPWRMSLQRNSGVNLGIVLFIGLFQIATFFPWPSFTTTVRRMPTRRMEFYGTADEERERNTERTRLLPAAVGGGGNTNTTHESETSQPTSNGESARVERPHVNPWEE